MGKIKKVGNLIATILLGDARDKIIETQKDVEYIRKEIDEDIKPTLKEVDKKVLVLWEKIFAVSHSPIRLNPLGEKILKGSGIKEMVDARLPELLDSVREKKPQNAYQVQEFSKQVVSDIKNDLNILSKLQDGAYKTGVDVDSVLLVGSLYLRDLVLPEFNFKLEEINGKKTS